MKRYLGDSVYASFDGQHIVLTTENGYPDNPSNTIYLDSRVLRALRDFQDSLANDAAQHLDMSNGQAHLQTVSEDEL